MTVSVYEVEVVTNRDGYRLLQHVQAESQQEAEDKVATIQKAAVISQNTVIKRDCTEAETTAFLAAKVLAEAIP